MNVKIQRARRYICYTEMKTGNLWKVFFFCHLWCSGKREATGSQVGIFPIVLPLRCFFFVFLYMGSHFCNIWTDSKDGQGKNPVDVHEMRGIAESYIRYSCHSTTLSPWQPCSENLAPPLTTQVCILRKTVIPVSRLFLYSRFRTALQRHLTLRKIV